MFRPNLLTKQEQRAVLTLIFLVLTLQVVAMIWPVDERLDSTTIYSEKFKSEYEILKQKSIEDKSPNFTPFNPNFLTPYKAYILGLSWQEFQRLSAFRKKNLWVNSAQDFQRVTKISDSLLHEIDMYFKFPEWVKKSQQDIILKPYKKLDLNSATATQLQIVKGIGPVLAQRIIRLRNTYKGGFANMVELMSVYGLTKDVLSNLKNKFTIKTPRFIQKINLNEANQEDLVTIPFIDYNLAYTIIEWRVLKENYKSIDELTKLKDFPVERLDIIKLYLYIK